MFNRLIIAVLTLALLFTFCGVAFSSNDAPKQGINPIDRTNPNAPKISDLQLANPSASFERPAPLDNKLETPTAILPPTYFCEFIEYSGGAVYYWTLPDDGGYPAEEYAMRMNAEPGYICSVMSVSIAVLGDLMLDPNNGAGMKVTLRDGAYNLLASMDFTNAQLPTSAAFVTADFSTANAGGPFTFVDGETFVIGAQVIGDGIDDTLFLASGDLQADESRQRMYFGAPYDGWYRWSWNDGTMWIHMTMGADVCCGRIPYTKCYTQEYAESDDAYYAWTIPDSYGDDYFNMRFSVTCPETLDEVGLAFDGYYTEGAPDLQIMGWYDDGAGFPDETNPIPGFPITVLNADIVYYPDYVIVDVPPIEMREDFHIGWTIIDNSGSGTDVLAILSDDGSNGVLRSSEFYNGAWGTMLGDWGYDVNFLIYAHLCKDEFCNCSSLSYPCTLSWFWRLPDRYGDIGDYQKFTPKGLGCRAEYGRIAFYWSSAEATLPLYTYNSAFQFFDVDAGNDDLPGTLLRADTITPADYVLYPGWTTVDYTGLPGGGMIFDQDIWFGVESFAPDTLSGIRTLSDNATCGDRRSAENWYGYMYYMVDDWGDDVNFWFELDVCCVPVPERPCFAGDDWPVYGHDFARSFASSSSLGEDPQGNLTLAWTYEGPEFGNLNSPVIHGDTVVYCALDELFAVSLNDGSLIWTLVADGFVLGSGIYCTPSIYTFNATDHGIDQSVVFCAGGDARSFIAIKLDTGLPFWTRVFPAHGLHFMTWGTHVVMDDPADGTPWLFYNDDDGDIYKVNALTGALDAVGWTTNPLNFGGFVGHGVTAGDDYLYIGTDHNIANGNVLAVDPTDGSIVWQLDPDQQLANIDADAYADPPNQPEAFTGTIAYDPETTDHPAYVFVVSEYSPSSENYGAGGVVYNLDPNTGALNWAAAGVAQDYCGVAVDGAHIINNGWTPWVPGYGTYRGPTAFVKETGAYLWDNTTTNPGLGDFWLADGALSCETGKPDLYVTGSRRDFLGFYDSDAGYMMWHRRFAGGYEYAHHYAPAISDGHLVYNYMNKLMCLTDQGPRPRLDIPLYIYPATVEFGSLDHTVVTWPNALGNRGGAELTIDSVVLADADNGTIPPPSAALSIVDIDRIEYMEHLADKFAGQSAMFRETLSNELSINDVINGVSSSRNNAAYALPSWVYTSTLTPTPGTVIPAPGDYLNDSIYIDITVEVNGTMVPRGEAVMFAYIYSDDPDYFLDSARGLAKAPHQVPVIQLSIVGGCLYDDVLMSFGAGGANTALIWNASKICDGDLSNSIEIDGDHASMWNGAFVFATDDPSTPPPGKPAFFSKRVAMYLDNWSAAYPATWQSALADVNCITGFCPPEHTTNVLLGTFSHDMGANYDDVMGDVVTYAMVDSVQDMCEYDTLANCLSWNWDWARGDQYGVQPPYDQTLTMGWHACVTVIGAQDEPELANFFIEKFEFDGRYGDVPNVWMGAILDVDIDGMDNNVAGYDEDLSAAWAYECNAPTNAWGMVKIPFGCDGETPLVNAKTLTANMAGWNDTSVWIDSLYYWMSSLTGLSHQPGTDPVICATDPDDREVFFTVSGFDIPAAPDKHTLGVAIFGLPSVADASDPATFEPLAKMANKWCGFGRGDTDNDNDIDIFDIARTISASMGGDGAYPFDYLADVNADGLINNDDVQILIGIVFFGTGAPAGAWVL